MTIFEQAIEAYGKDMQLNVAVEELSELIKEICKSKRGNDNRDNIIEEMADCYIMLEQLEIIFDLKPVEILVAIDQKLARLKNRIETMEKEIKL